MVRQGSKGFETLLSEMDSALRSRIGNVEQSAFMIFFSLLFYILLFPFSAFHLSFLPLYTYIHHAVWVIDFLLTNRPSVAVFLTMLRYIL